MSTTGNVGLKFRFCFQNRRFGGRKSIVKSNLDKNVLVAFFRVLQKDNAVANVFSISLLCWKAPSEHFCSGMGLRKCCWLNKPTLFGCISKGSFDNGDTLLQFYQRCNCFVVTRINATARKGIFPVPCSPDLEWEKIPQFLQYDGIKCERESREETALHLVWSGVEHKTFSLERSILYLSCLQKLKVVADAELKNWEMNFSIDITIIYL